MFEKRLIFLLVVLQLTVSQETDPKIAEQLYIKLFRKQRIEQLTAVKNFLRIPSYEKLYNMVTVMAEKVFTVIQDSRATIESSSYIPGVSDFPLDERIRNALTNILENTALFAEIVLRFPELSASVLKINNNWGILLQWGIAFSSQAKYLLDQSTVMLLHYVSQELSHVEKDPNYINPYRVLDEIKKEKEKEAKIKRKNKKKIKKGPRIHYDL